MVDDSQINTQIEQMKVELKPVIDEIVERVKKQHSRLFSEAIGWGYDNQNYGKFCDFKEYHQTAYSRLNLYTHTYISEIEELELRPLIYPKGTDFEMSRISTLLEALSILIYTNEFEALSVFPRTDFVDLIVHTKDTTPRMLVSLAMLFEGTCYVSKFTELIERAKAKLAQAESVKNPLARDGETLEAPAFASRPVPSISQPRAPKKTTVR